MRRRVFGTTFSAIFVAIALIGCANPTIVKKTPTEQAAVVAESPPLVGTTVDNQDGTYSIEFPLPPSSGGKASLVDGRSLVNYENVADLQQAVNYYQLVLVDDDEQDKIWASTSVTNNIPHRSDAGGTLSSVAPAWA